MPFDQMEIDNLKLSALREKTEGHFLEFKSRQIRPSKLTRTLCAFANSDGGEVYIGIEDPGQGFEWDGFSTQEDANGFVQEFEKLFPLGAGLRYTFISHDAEQGLVLWVEVEKSIKIIKTNDDEIYVRRSAQDIKLTDPSSIERLEHYKGISSHEDELVRL